MAEEKRRSDKLYDSSASKKARGEKVERTSSDDQAPAGGAAADQPAKTSTLGELLAEMEDRHEKERKDHYGLIDKLHKRHREERDVALAKHGTHLEAGPGVTSEEA